MKFFGQQQVVDMQQQFKFGTSEIPYTLLREIDGESDEFDRDIELVISNDGFGYTIIEMLTAWEKEEIR